MVAAVLTLPVASYRGDVLLPPDGCVYLKDKKDPVVNQV